MSDRTYLSAVPAFYATSNGTSLPFIVSMLLVDELQQRRLTPAVERSINSTIEITGRVGLVTAIISDTDDLPQRAVQYIHRVCAMKEEAILLFLCQSGETAEKVMQSINTGFQISLVQRTPSVPATNL